MDNELQLEILDMFYLFEEGNYRRIFLKKIQLAGSPVHILNIENSI